MRRTAFPGHVLREQREARGLSLDDVYHHIKVPPEYIKALEESKLKVFRVPTYALGYVASYCRFLELDPERFLLAYREAQSIPVAPAARAMAAPARQDAAAGERPVWMSELLTWGAVFAAILFIWGAYTLVIVRPMAEEAERRVDAGTFELEIVPPEHHFPEDMY